LLGWGGADEGNEKGGGVKERPLAQSKALFCICTCAHKKEEREKRERPLAQSKALFFAFEEGEKKRGKREK
jgi:hypothetical protein